MKPPSPHGLAGMFTSADDLLAALRRLRDEGYEGLEVYTPWPVEEARELIPHRRSRVPAIMLATGFCGMIGAFMLQVWGTSDYPIEVAGRPVFSWVPYVPVTFELTVLTASLCGLAGFLILSKLPRLDHPMFGHSEFERASQDAFFVCILTSDPKYHVQETPRLLRTLGATAIEEVGG